MSGYKFNEFALDDNALLRAQNMFIDVESPTENPKMNCATTRHYTQEKSTISFSDAASAYMAYNEKKQAEEPAT